MPSNSYFEFKHFNINQDQCAMKVSTDSCTFGAWVPLHPSQVKILDIGAGTGLLSLMLAQRFPQVQIDAIEVEERAYQQATDNVKASKFASQITVRHSAIQAFQAAGLYDAIITNPPFFQQSLKSPNQQVNHAKHDDGLTLDELVQQVNRLLKPNGQWFVLLPVVESDVLEVLAKKEGWVATQKTFLAHTPTKQPNRRFTTFTKQIEPQAIVCSENWLNIFDESGKKYDETFVLLLKDFYLAF